LRTYLVSMFTRQDYWLGFLFEGIAQNEAEGSIVQ